MGGAGEHAHVGPDLGKQLLRPVLARPGMLCRRSKAGEYPCSAISLRREESLLGTPMLSLRASLYTQAALLDPPLRLLDRTDSTRIQVD